MDVKVKKLLFVLVLATILLTSTMAGGLALKEAVKYAPVMSIGKFAQISQSKNNNVQKNDDVYGYTYTRAVGENVVMYGKKLTLKNVGSAETNTPIIVDVDGIIEVVTGIETVNGLRIKVVATHWEEDINKRTASIKLNPA